MPYVATCPPLPCVSALQLSGDRGAGRRVRGVTKDVPDYALVVGNPGRIVGWICECGYRLNFENGGATCDDCGKQYRQSQAGVRRLEDGWLGQQTIAEA